MKKTNHQVFPVKRLSRKKKYLFILFSLLTPFLFLAILETGLRVFHYGYNLDLFMEYPPDPDFFVLNPDASKKYFVNEALAPSGNSEIFKKTKDKNTFRVFVLGESTTIGFPYFHNGSFHRWLLYRFMHAYPDMQFEIVNLSLTGVNSYTVLDFSKQLINYEPDAVLIYSGHNEYYGALGVGSTNKIGNNRFLIQFMLKLRQLRLVQLITHFLLHTASPNTSHGYNTGATFMQLMVSEQNIPFQSGLYYKGLDQFRENIGEALDILNKHHIPVFISNTVSNEKDLKPFTSNEPTGKQYAYFAQQYKLGQKAYTLHEYDSAIHHFTLADDIFSGNAGCKFFIGKLAYQNGDYARAKQYFEMASDLDELRFRAPSQINKILVELCSKYPNTRLVDSKSDFESCSENKIIGNKLILEHVHPNLLGYALLSNAFYQSIKKTGLLISKDNKEISFDSLLRSMPITKIDSLTASYRISILENNWPFRTTPAMQTPETPQHESEEEKLSHQIVQKEVSWRLAMDELYSFYIDHKDYLNAKRIAEALVLEHPTEESLYEKAANICGELKEYESAAFYFRKSFDLSPSFNLAKFLFVIDLKLDRPLSALPYLEYAISHNESGRNLLPLQSQAHEIIELEKLYLADSLHSSAPNRIAGKYLSMGNVEGANKYVGITLRKDAKNKEALYILSKIKSAENSDAK